MITLQKTDYQQMEQAAADAGVTLPIEQTDVWARFQADIPGRTPWGVYLIQRDGETVAFIAFIDMETHGYHYLRSMHGPVWIVKPDEALEREAIDAIAAEVHRADRQRGVHPHRHVVHRRHRAGAGRPCRTTRPW